MLSSEKETNATRDRVMRAARAILGNRKRLWAFFEHGHWWVEDRETGEQWDAVDAEGGTSVDGFDFERMS